MQHTGSIWPLLSIGRATALSLSLFALTGCVSAIAEGDGLDPKDQATAQAAPAENESGPPDGNIVALGDEGSTPLQEDVPAQAGPDTTALQQGLTMQSTALRAASSSIYGQSPAAAVPGDQDAPSSRPAISATTNSLFGSGQPAAQPVILPQQGASNEPPATAPVAAGRVAALATAAEDDLPATVPLPLSAGAARAGDVSAALQPVEVASADPVLQPETLSAPVTDSGDTEPEGTSKAWTFASLFAPKRKEKPRNGGSRNTQASEEKTITAKDVPEPRVASLAYASLPGVNMKPLFSMEHADHVVEDDEPVEVATLSGLARLAPSGLVLQTEKVETGCFKPELLQLLKMVEQHYGQRVMVTSGLRPIKVSRKRQSLHTRCEAADIQVKGISKWELADYLRSLPGRGGVGTYCHTESVHIDIGPQRDWNWRCRRRG
ncbi:D-Ala-D-Ala carboxypeptidase family metallohydrolase [Ensifer sp. LCM 4579]|uniref:D-Ala-D-Ala carboxypeptidase family metallohydrolase n=1 Tax=Ensifer sp. LCM 4579 TaxID=1848292 RepID=UPI0008DB32A8|nr:hypothetical protein LCM4579_14025 [Ensifer sp. LCM 4579]